MKSKLYFGSSHAEGNISVENQQSHLFSYPCSKEECYPIKVNLKPGKYLFECWGAGGNYYVNSNSGKGSYTRGKIDLKSYQTFYLYIGSTNLGTQVDNISSGGYNGGGKAYYWASPGAGATDIRLSKGIWNDTLSLASRIMVAAGGGGANDNINGGDGGDLNGIDGSNTDCTTQCGAVASAFGATQSSGGKGLVDGKFGQGGSFAYLTNEVDGAGGGGGYFGGGKAGGCEYSGAGGSSFISGHEGCIAIKEPNEKTSQIEMSTSSEHYSGLKFYDTVMIAGNKEIDSPSGTKETGHKGNGFVRITKIGSIVMICSHKNSFKSPISMLLVFIIYK